MVPLFTQSTTEPVLPPAMPPLSETVSESWAAVSSVDVMSTKLSVSSFSSFSEMLVFTLAWFSQLRIMPLLKPAMPPV